MSRSNGGFAWRCAEISLVGFLASAIDATLRNQKLRRTFAEGLAATAIDRASYESFALCSPISIVSSLQSGQKAGKISIASYDPFAALTGTK